MMEGVPPFIIFIRSNYIYILYIKMATWFVPLLIDILLINALRGHLLGIW